MRWSVWRKQFTNKYLGGQCYFNIYSDQILEFDPLTAGRAPGFHLSRYCPVGACRQDDPGKGFLRCVSDPVWIRTDSTNILSFNNKLYSKVMYLAQLVQCYIHWYIDIWYYTTEKIEFNWLFAMRIENCTVYQLPVACGQIWAFEKIFIFSFFNIWIVWKDIINPCKHLQLLIGELNSVLNTVISDSITVTGATVHIWSSLWTHHHQSPECFTSHFITSSHKHTI